MKNTPYIYLANLCMILICILGVAFGQADQQEATDIDILKQHIQKHEDSPKTEKLRNLGSPRGQDISRTRSANIDILKERNKQLLKKTGPINQTLGKEIEENKAISIPFSSKINESVQEVSIYTRISNWLGKIFVILSGLLLVLGGVYLFGQRQKDQEPQPDEMTTSANPEEFGFHGNSNVPGVPRSNAYERFVGNLKTDFSAGNTEKVIRQLLVLTKGTNTHDIVIMLANQWDELEAEHLAGRLSTAFYLEDKENVKKTISELIEELEG